MAGYDMLEIRSTYSNPSHTTDSYPLFFGCVQLCGQGCCVLCICDFKCVHTKKLVYCTPEGSSVLGARL